jgi:threonine dehydrogenase-like Zn-dependent dehydrogenase
MKGLARIAQDELGWVEKEKPKCGPYDAIVRPIALAPCTSDVHIVWGHAYMSDEPNRIVGHESTGVVEEVGSMVKDFKPGDRVIVPAITPDFKTVNSQKGFGQHAYGMGTGMTFITFKDGVFAEYFHVNDADANLALLPDDVTLEQAVMISDMMTTGFYGAELADIKPGDEVAVFGIGPVGLMGVAGASFMGASRILAVGSRPTAIKVAKEYGASEIIDYHNGNTVEQIMELTDNQGVDKVVIGGGNANTLSEALEVLKVGGTIGNVLHYDGVETIPISALGWGAGLADKTIRGGVCPGGRARMEQLVKLVQYGRFDSSKLITHKYNKCENIEDAMIVMRDKPKDLIKPAVIFDD